MKGNIQKEKDHERQDLKKKKKKEKKRLRDLITNRKGKRNIVS